MSKLWVGNRNFRTRVASYHFGFFSRLYNQPKEISFLSFPKAVTPLSQYCSPALLVSPMVSFTGCINEPFTVTRRSSKKAKVVIHGAKQKSCGAICVGTLMLHLDSKVTVYPVFQDVPM